MQLTVGRNISYAFVVLAVGLMVTDFCRLLREPSDAAFSAANGTHQVHKI
jgi:hypothetical protein